MKIVDNIMLVLFYDSNSNTNGKELFVSMLRYGLS